MRAFARFRLVTIGLAALAALLVLPGGAVAAPPPQVERGSESYSFTVPAAEHPCGVDVGVTGRVRFVDVIYFNNAGDVVKVVSTIHDAWTETGPDGGRVNGRA